MTETSKPCYSAEVAKSPKSKRISKAPEIPSDDPQWQALVQPLIRSVGRPTLYDPKYCTDVVRYFASKPPYRMVQTMFGPKLLPNDLPTLAGFAVSIGVSKKTINNWCDEHSEFLRAVEMAKAVQEHIWATNTLHKLYDRTFSIFFGKNNLGYVEKVIQEIEDKRDDPVADLAAELFARAAGVGDTGADAPARPRPATEGGIAGGGPAALPALLPPGVSDAPVPVPDPGGEGSAVEPAGDAGGRVHQDRAPVGEDGNRHAGDQVPDGFPAAPAGPAADGGDRLPERGAGEDGRGSPEKVDPAPEAPVGP